MTWYATKVPPDGQAHYSAITNDSQRIEAYAVGSDGNLYWAFQPGGTEGFMLSEFVSLGGPPWGLVPSQSVGLGVNKAVPPAGRVEVFAITTLVENFVLVDSALAHIWQTKPGTQSLAGWSGWGILPPPPNTPIYAPVVARNADGRLEVFAIGGEPKGNNGVYHIWQNSSPPWWQAGWPQIMVQDEIQYLNGGAVAVTNPPAGWLQAFAMQAPFLADGQFAGQMWCDWQCAENSIGGWFAPNFPSLGLPPGFSNQTSLLYSTPSVAVNADGRLEVFVGMFDGTVWHIFQTAPAGADCTKLPPWSAWTPLGSPAGGDLGEYIPVPAAALNPITGFLEVYVVGLDGALWNNSQNPTGPNDGWGNWQSLGSPEGFELELNQSPSLAVDFAQRIWAFLEGTNGWCFYTPNHFP
jgi:hypothetical protein